MQWATLAMFGLAALTNVLAHRLLSHVQRLLAADTSDRQKHIQALLRTHNGKTLARDMAKGGGADDRPKSTGGRTPKEQAEARRALEHAERIIRKARRRGEHEGAARLEGS